MKRMWSRNELLKMNDAQIRALIESGEIDNAKPIYIHPLELYKTSVGSLTCLIFNNSPEAINTWEKVKQAIHNFGSDSYNRLLVSGAFKDDTKVIVAGEIIETVSTSTFGLYGIATDGTSYLESPYDLTNATFNSITDSVNKIN